MDSDSGVLVYRCNIQEIFLHKYICFAAERKKHKQFCRRYPVCLESNHSSSPRCQQDSNRGQLRTFHSLHIIGKCGLAKNFNSITQSLHITDAATEKCACVCMNLNTYLWSKASGWEVKCAAAMRRKAVDMEKKEYKAVSIYVSHFRPEMLTNTCFLNIFKANYKLKTN